MIGRAMFVGLVLLGACGPTILPPEGPNTEYPCGIHGKSCGNHMCCEENDVCGHDGPFSRCEPGYCCYDGPAPWPGAAGAQKRRQWPEAAP